MKVLLLLSLLIASQSFSQTVRGLYVDGFSTILGVQEKEDSLLRFAENNGFNYLTLYQMHMVNANTPLTDVTTAQPFADFVSKAKTQFNIARIGVASENFNAFSTVYHIYNQQHPDPNERIDVYNLEFEFWVPASVEPGGAYCDDYLAPNGIPCDTAGAFSFFKANLHKIDSLAETDGAISEAYFGWFNNGQAIQIIETGVDRILLSTYIPSANYSAGYQYNYLETRLQQLAQANTNVKILPLYSAETDFMHDWSVVNPFFQPFNDLSNSLQAETSSWKQFLQPEGIQWFAYTDMPKKNMDLGLNEQTFEKSIVYPNPSTGKVHLRSNGKIENQVLLSIDGMVLECIDVDQTSISGLAPGIYFLRILHPESIENIKIVIE